MKIKMQQFEKVVIMFIWDFSPCIIYSSVDVEIQKGQLAIFLHQWPSFQICVEPFIHLVFLVTIYTLN